MVDMPALSVRLLQRRTLKACVFFVASTDIPATFGVVLVNHIWQTQATNGRCKRLQNEL